MMLIFSMGAKRNLPKNNSEIKIVIIFDIKSRNPGRQPQVYSPGFGYNRRTDIFDNKKIFFQVKLKMMCPKKNFF